LAEETVRDLGHFPMLFGPTHNDKTRGEAR
jgi:hypothetical protein